MEKIPNQKLLFASIERMAAFGNPMERVSTGTRAMKYLLKDGKTVRVRTCNDHVLVVLANVAEEQASLNIEGTDYLLIAMPATPRQPGPIIVYFLPTEIAVNDVRSAHRAWLKSGSIPKANNRTWNIWFDTGPAGCSGFAERWAKYQLSDNTKLEKSKTTGTQHKTLGAVIASARADIALAAGVPVEAVKITVALD